LISEALFFVDMNQTSLETIGHHKESRGPGKGEEKEGDEKLPLETNVVQAT